MGDIPYSRTQGSILKMSVLPNFIYKLNIILIKIPASYFMTNDELLVKFKWRVKRPRTVNTILKTNKVRR